RADIVHEESFRVAREGERERVDVRDAEPEAHPTAAARNLPREVATALGIAEYEEATLGREVLERPAHQAAEGAPRRPATPEGGGQLEHEPELPLRVPLVLPEVADQVGDGQEIDRADEMDVANADVARDEEGEWIEQCQHDGDQHRRAKSPAHADARDHEHVEEEEGAGSPFSEHTDQADPDDVDRRRVPSD